MIRASKNFEYLPENNLFLGFVGLSWAHCNTALSEWQGYFISAEWY